MKYREQTVSQDRILGAHVRSGITMKVLRHSLVAALLLVGAACSKDKKASTTPSATSGGTPTANGGDGSMGGDTSGEPGSGEPGAGAADDAAEAAAVAAADGISPPGVDLTPAEQKAKVSEHLKNVQGILKDSKPDPDRLIAESQLVLQADETNVDAMVYLAYGNYLKGYNDMAEDILTKVMSRGGDKNKQAHFVAGLIADRREMFDKAMASYEKAVALDRNYVSGLVNLGVHYLRNKRYQDSVTLYERLTSQLGVNTPQAWTNLGSAYRGASAEYNLSDVKKRNELLVKTDQAYKKAISLDKSYGPAYFNLGLLYLDADPFPKNGKEDLDRIERLQTSKGHFDSYRNQPGANQNKADDMVSVVQKLIDKEEGLRKKAAEREAKRKAKEASEPKPAETPADKAAKPDAAKPDGTKPSDPAKPDAAKPDAAKPDAKPADPAKPDAAKPADPAKPAASEPAKPEAGKDTKQP